MKIDVVLRTEGQPEATVAEVEADDWPEMKINLSAALRTLAVNFETAPDELPT